MSRKAGRRLALACSLCLLLLLLSAFPTSRLGLLLGPGLIFLYWPWCFVVVIGFFSQLFSNHPGICCCILFVLSILVTAVFRRSEYSGSDLLEASIKISRSSLLPILWVVITFGSILGPVVFLFMYRKLFPGAPWLFVLLYFEMFAINVFLLYQGHKRFASARAGIILTLLLAFYLLAAFTVVVDFRALDPVHWYLGIVVLAAFLPLRFKNTDPGIRLERRDEPAIWECIDEVAASTGQAAPSMIFCAPTVNAFAGRTRGSTFLVLGLPLMAILRRGELRAVIAHEFGHFKSNDTAWAVPIYRCRNKVEEVVARFKEFEDMFPKRCFGGGCRISIKLASMPFWAYKFLFRRAVRTVVEAQEFAADQVAAKFAGAEALISAITTVSGASGAFESYWNQIALPYICSQQDPKLASGFAEYFLNPDIRLEMSRREALPVMGFASLDFHPPVAKRVARLASSFQTVDYLPSSDLAATSLLRNVQSCERDLLAFMGYRFSQSLDES